MSQMFLILSIKIEKIFEPDSDLVELALRNYRDDLVHNQNAFAQQENDEVSSEIANETHDDEVERENLAMKNMDLTYHLLVL